MNVLVVGGGGREHALIRRIKESPRVSALYALPGNGGIARDAVCAPVAASDIPGIVAFAREKAIDFAVIAPEDPLALGAVDALHGAGIRCFGPTKGAAEIESSKAFAKELMRKYHIPTAEFAVFEDYDRALAYLRAGPFPVVVKADGLAVGKGVFIAQDYGEAEAAVRAMMREGAFGASGSRVVIEACLEGPEVTVLAFTDGQTVVPMASAMDHKRALEGDLGPNTGGMGVIAPSPFYTEEIARRCMEEIFRPTVAALRAEGRLFQGCLYFGLMLTEEGPKVIEYNCRFGDPEAQAVLSLLEGDLLAVLEAVEDGRLGEIEAAFSAKAACCVMVASGGYPGAYVKGRGIDIGPLPEGVTLFHSGTALQGGRLVTAGGRVLGVTAVADTLPLAVETALRGAEAVKFEGAYYRRDIGRRALEAK